MAIAQMTQNDLTGVSTSGAGTAGTGTTETGTPGGAPRGMQVSQLPNAAALKVLFEQRRTALLQLLEEASPPADCDDERNAALMKALHQMAGVAGLFGEEMLGQAASDGEYALRAAQPADRAAIIARIRAGIAASQVA